MKLLTKRRGPAARRLRRGFNLIEVCLAAMLFAIGTLIFAALYPAAARGAKMAGSFAQAVSVMQHKVDQLRAVGYGSLDYTNLVATGLIDARGNTQPYHFETVDSIGQQFCQPNATVTVSDYATDLKRVDISLTWYDGPGSPNVRSHAITILIARAQ